MGHRQPHLDGGTTGYKEITRKSRQGEVTRRKMGVGRSRSASKGGQEGPLLGGEIWPKTQTKRRSQMRGRAEGRNFQVEEQKHKDFLNREST